MSIRQDKFQVGDRVTFITNDPYPDIPKTYRKRWGDGPYEIEQVHEADQISGALGHTQTVRVNGVGFSGYWFSPVR